MRGEATSRDNPVGRAFTISGIHFPFTACGAGLRNPFTPDGTGTVVDMATDGDGKLFFTITTPSENVFYLIIDQQRSGNNVYFLNAVTENDLMALAEPSDNTASENAIPDSAGTSEPADDPAPSTGQEQKAEAEPEDKQGGAGMIIFAVVVILGAGGAGYYFKIYRPKQQNADSGGEYEEYEATAHDADAWEDDAAPYPDDEDAPPWDEDYDTNDGEGEEE